MLFDGFNTKYKLACILFTSFCLSACGGSGDSTPPPPPKIPPTYKISGAAVKGPLQFAIVKVFQFDSTKTESSLENALAAAERDVKSIFGLGIGSDIDLLKIPPILTSETNSAETQSASWATRTANEASAALIYQLYIKIP